MQSDYYSGDTVIFSPHILGYQATEDFITDCLASEAFRNVFPDVKTIEDVEALLETPNGYRPNGHIIHVKGEVSEDRIERSQKMREQEVFIDKFKLDNGVV